MTGQNTVQDTAPGWHRQSKASALSTAHALHGQQHDEPAHRGWLTQGSRLGVQGKAQARVGQAQGTRGKAGRTGRCEAMPCRARTVKDDLLQGGTDRSGHQRKCCTPGLMEHQRQQTAGPHSRAGHSRVHC